MRRSRAWLACHADVLERLAIEREAEGAADFRARKMANPYPKHSRAGLAWARGFDRARDELDNVIPRSSPQTRPSAQPAAQSPSSAVDVEARQPYWVD